MNVKGTDITVLRGDLWHGDRERIDSNVQGAIAATQPSPGR